jgi:hypothetical protein
VGEKHITAKIINLNGADPLLYAAKQAIGPRQLNDEEAKNTARRAYQNNPNLSPKDIGKAIGRARRTVDLYIADLRAKAQMEFDLKLYRMKKIGIPQDRISRRLNVAQQTISDHLPDLVMLPNPVNSDLKKGFTVFQTAEKHGWPESLVWALKLDGKNDLGKYRNKMGSSLPLRAPIKTGKE